MTGLGLALLLLVALIMGVQLALSFGVLRAGMRGVSSLPPGAGMVVSMRVREGRGGAGSAASGRARSSSMGIEIVSAGVVRKEGEGGTEEGWSGCAGRRIRDAGVAGQGA